MMLNSLIVKAIVQCVLLVSGQVFLKIALQRMEPFGWNMTFFRSVLLNWQFALCGACYAAGSLLWLHIVKHYPFSMAYPMISLSYVLGMVAAIIFFHETVDWVKWMGVAFIVLGCFLIAK
jgi:drug/metabolite transporter (DMT)-like permease